VSESQQFLFVYGTLRQDIAHPMTEFLRRYASRIGGAWFRGKLFDLGDYPAAVPSDEASDRVAGELYRIEPGHEAALFAELDRYQDCDPKDASAGEYVRLRARVEREGDESLQAWICQYNRPTAALKRIDSGDYSAHLRAARKKI